MADSSNEAPRPDDKDPGEPGASAFVWGAWALMAAMAVGYVVRFGADLPVWDDFDVVAVVTGERPVTTEWLWSQHNEHRVPLPRLVLLGLMRATGNDFRSGMVFSVVGLAALAGAAVFAAGRRRGSRTFDVLFPLALLNLSHHANLLWSWQVGFVLPTVVAGLILLIASRPDWPGPSAAAVAGVGLASLCLCGANGLALVPALACWLLAAAIGHWASGRPHGRLKGLAVLALTAPALALVALYVAGYRRAGHHPEAAGFVEAMTTGLQFLGLMFGTSARAFWPVSGWAALAVVTVSAAVAARAATLGPAEGRPRAVGLLCAFTALGSLVLGLGWGRAGSGELAGLEPRYVTIVAPLWLAVFFAWDVGSSPAVRRVVLTGLVATLSVLLWPNTRAGLEFGREHIRQARAFERDLRGGTSPYLLVKRYTPFLHPSQDALLDGLGALRRARVGVFRALRPDPKFREAVVPVEPAGVNLARWENGTAHVTGVDPELHFVLPEALPVAGVRLRYAHANKSGGPARFRFSWTSEGATRPAAGQQFSNWALPTGRGRVTTVWVADRVKEFWVQPDNQPCEFTPEGITLLVPVR
jgi:hypothetical protein